MTATHVRFSGSMNQVGLSSTSIAHLRLTVTDIDDVGVDHEPVKDIGPSYILEFRDPDNIALELTAPK